MMITRTLCVVPKYSLSMQRRAISLRKVKENASSGLYFITGKVNTKRKKLADKLIPDSNSIFKHLGENKDARKKSIGRVILAMFKGKDNPEVNDGPYVNPRESNVVRCFIEFDKHLNTKGIVVCEDCKTPACCDTDSTDLIEVKHIEEVKGRKWTAAFHAYREGVYDRVVDYLISKQKDASASRIEKILIANARKILRNIIHKLLVSLFQLLIALQLGKVLPKSAELILIKRRKKFLIK
eukprot:TRINITY_DN3151_c0_g3_i1.p1 TRINITY_DN3151_c0_g3~~TRINITY_DN3151_c0_g3_i1.p1  ORF type:complete len:271 (-),score=11.77 TRINITY_DN3151_c0_g3_i1:73-789(-)